MKAVVKARPVDGRKWHHGFTLTDKPAPKVTAPSDVIIKVYAAAICGTDIGIYQAKDSLYKSMQNAKTDPITVGHEFSGHVVAAGAKAKKQLAHYLFERAAKNPAIKKLLRGKTAASLAEEKNFIEMLRTKFSATAEMHVICWKCYQCKQGEGHVCRNTIINGLHNDGAFAEYVKVPAENVLLYLNGEIPLEVMAFMDAIGNATHTVFSVDVRGASVVVLGCGVQGLMATAVAKFAGARRIYVTDASHGELTHDKLVAQRFRLAKIYGAKDCFDMSLPEERQRFRDVVMRDTAHTGADAAFDMSGAYSAYRNAFEVLRMGGTFSLLGLPAGTMEVDFAKDIIFKGLTIKGIIGRRMFDTWDQMEVLLKSGLADMFMKTGFITHQFPLEEFDAAFNVMLKGDGFKILLKP